MILASPKAVYKALMDSKLHAKFTGAPAKISKQVGGSFSAHGGYIKGKNLVLIPGKKIAQSWHASDWPKGHMSEIVYLLKKTKHGAKLIFTHKGVPIEHAKSIASGWKIYYWHPLKLMLEKK